MVPKNKNKIFKTKLKKNLKEEEKIQLKEIGLFSALPSIINFSIYNIIHQCHSQCCLFVFISLFHPLPREYLFHSEDLLWNKKQHLLILRNGLFSVIWIRAFCFFQWYGFQRFVCMIDLLHILHIFVIETFLRNGPDNNNKIFIWLIRGK